MAPVIDSRSAVGESSGQGGQSGQSGPSGQGGQTGQPIRSAPARTGRPVSLARQREMAKVGMVVSLTALVVTGFTGTHHHGPSRTIHLVSGAALVGFSLWHYSLYGRPAPKPQENPA